MDLAPKFYPIYVFEDAIGRSMQWLWQEAGSTKMTASFLAVLPEGTNAILVLATPGSQGAVKQLFDCFCKVDDHVPPIVVMLFGPHDGADRCTAVLSAQAALLNAGAADVLIKPDGADLKIGLSMAALRVGSKLASEDVLERHIFHQNERIRKLQLTLWKQVRTSLPDFPQVQFECPEELGPGDQIGPLMLQRVVGAGAAGKVYFATNERAKRIEAVKAVPKASLDTLQEVRDVLHEASVLRMLKHDNIVKCFGFIHATNFLVIRMEPAGGRNLFRYMCDNGGRCAVDRARSLGSQIAQAVNHCHERGVAHADLKPENVMVSKDGLHAKLVDFGMAVDACGPRTDLRGTMPFIAPEILSEAPYTPAPVDVWALGVLILEMLCGTGKLNRMMLWPQKISPEPQHHGELARFFPNQPESRARVICTALEADDVCPSCSIVSVLRGALDVDPASRLTVAQLAHSEWLSGEDMLPRVGCA
jgi:tRNA A-37 threonylcarbamoyl transferase component Bud32